LNNPRFFVNISVDYKRKFHLNTHKIISKSSVCDLRQLLRPDPDVTTAVEFILSPYVLFHVIHDVELIISIILMLLEAREVDSMAEVVSFSVGVILLDSANWGSAICVVESFLENMCPPLSWFRQQICHRGRYMEVCGRG
jgi:hypothetical protein